MKKTLIQIGITGLLMLAGCGNGSGNISDSARQLLIDFGDPTANLSLTDGDYEYRMALYYDANGTKGDLIFGPAEMNSYNEDENVYYTRIDNILDGHYILEVTLVRDIRDETYSSLSETGFLALSGYQSFVEIEGNESSTNLSQIEWESSIYDDDADGLTNLDEIHAGTIPFASDTDGDGVSDGADAFPVNPEESSDFDGDGFGDNHDNDIDNDGLSNADESALGTDVVNPDSDGDTVVDGTDNCPLNSNVSQNDTDGNGDGDECDSDMDDDGLSNSSEIALGTNTRLKDTDGDGVDDQHDLFPLLVTESLDTDGDGIGNNADPDDDNDSLLDSQEILLGSDPLSSDSDGDGIRDNGDNCVIVSNSGQNNNDADAMGDDCDLDDDNDSLLDTEESQIGTDGFITNRLFADTDGDGFNDNVDNCPLDDNLDQNDSDGDEFGDACDCRVNDVAINQLAVDHPDNQVLDTNCDGIDGDKYKAIFVSSDGTVSPQTSDAGDPTSDLNAAIDFAAQNDWDVYIAQGDYNISTLVLKDGVDLYGGFSSDYLERDTTGRAYPTRFAHTSGDANNATLTVSGFENETILAGFVFENHSTLDDQNILYVEGSNLVLENNTFYGNTGINSENLVFAADSTLRISGNRFYGLSSYDATGLTAVDSDATITNNIFSMGSAEHTVGLMLAGGTALVVNNTIDGGQHSSGFSYGIQLTETSPQIINNVIITENDRNQASVICDGPTLSDSVTMENNLFVRLTSRSVTYAPYVTCDGTHLLTNDALENSDEISARDNIVFAETLISDLAEILSAESDYALVSASVAIDAGQDADTENQGSVLFDINGKPRAPEFYDMGAYEF